MRRCSWAPWTALLMVVSSVSVASAQDLVVGAYTPAPVGFNLITVSGLFSTGGLSFDPTLPVEDASAKLGGGFVGYGRTFRLGGRFASAIFGVPFVKGHIQGPAAWPAAGAEPRWIWRSCRARRRQFVRCAGDDAGGICQVPRPHRRRRQPRCERTTRSV